ncbi:MAG: Ig-like domain-containing protein [Gemmatimonadaceae bacterium]
MRYVAILALFVVGCGDTVQPDARNELVALAIQPPSLAMRVGQTAQLRAVGITASGDTLLQNPSVQWSSHDAAVASVDSTGRLTAIHCCRTTIEARVGEIKALMDLIVAGPVCSAMVVSPASVTLRVGEQVRASARGGDPLCSTFSWSSNAPAVAAVTDSGVVTALSAGQAAIVARSKSDTTLFGVSAVTVVP